MQYNANSPEEYIVQLTIQRQEAVSKLRDIIKSNLPEGFEEIMSYGMIGYVIPHSIYPVGYHVNPNEPLPFMGLASQKNHIAMYHMGIYAFPEILEWFINEYPKHVATKPDMGKSCIRFKNVKRIPYDLISELCRKINPEDYIARYEELLERK